LTFSSDKFEEVVKLLKKW